MPDAPTLLPHHFEQLTQGSGIAPEVIRGRGYCSIVPPEGYTVLKQLGFARAQAKLTPGLLIPILDIDGQPVLYQYKPDEPRLDSKGKPIKYETPRGARMRLDCAADQRESLGNPGIPLWVTEGIKKLDALRTHDLCAIGILGTSNWRGSNVDGGKVALPDWERVALNDRDVYIVFDSDVITKPQVQGALRRLRGFLAQRGARPVTVLLPANGQSKVGVDDFLLTHTVPELLALTTPQELSGNHQESSDAHPYRVTARGLAWLRQTRDGDIPVPLTNFGAKIVADIVHDDGLEASLAGGSHRFAVPAAQFPGLGWVAEHLGAQAMVYPGQLLKDHTRTAIQCVSDLIVERRVFAYTGWRKNRDGAWYFFHGGGVLGVYGPLPNMEVSLPPSLEPMKLPEPPSGPPLIAAIRASLRLLDAAPDTSTVPVWLAIWRAVVGQTDFVVHLTGGTGAGKTELGTLAQQHVGASFHPRNLPGSWMSTGNSLEDLAFVAKDVILVVDDFAPTGSVADIARIHREADRVLRAQGNRSGRGRLRADGSQRPIRPPRELILSTGEEIPKGQSLRARLVTIEMSKDTTQWTQLAICRRDAMAGLYAEALAGYIRWLALQYEQVREALQHDTEILRDEAYQEDQHRRTVSNIASLAAGLRPWIRFAHTAGALADDESDALWQRCWITLMHLSDHQQRYQNTSEPSQHFLRLLSAAIASGRAHLASSAGDEPQTPQAYGWRQVILGTGPYVNTAWQPQGRCIGWLDGKDVYLDPEASYAEAQALAKVQGDALSVSPQTLRKRLHERRVLMSTDESRQTLTVRRKLAEQQRAVLHVHIQTLSIE